MGFDRCSRRGKEKKKEGGVTIDEGVGWGEMLGFFWSSENFSERVRITEGVQITEEAWGCGEKKFRGAACSDVDNR